MLRFLSNFHTPIHVYGLWHFQGLRSKSDSIFKRILKHSFAKFILFNCASFETFYVMVSKKVLEQ